MTGYAVWIHMALVVVGSLSCCCAAALLASELRTLFRAVFGIFYGPVSQIRERVSRYLQGTKVWLLAQVADESDRKGDGPLYYIIGAVLYTILTALFVLCDFGMVVITLQAMGMEEIKVELPIDTSTLTGATLVSTALFWGAILFDLLGVTRLAPWRRSLSESNRRMFISIAIFFVAVTVFIGAAMAYWRGGSLVETPEAHAASMFGPERSGSGLSLGDSGSSSSIGAGYLPEREDVLPSDDASNWIVLATLTGISGLSLASTAFSMVGLGIMIKFAILLLITLGTICLLPVSFCSWAVAGLLNGINFAIESILDVFVAAGNHVLGLFRRRPAGGNAPPASVRPTPNQAEEIPPPAPGAQTHSTASDPGFDPFAERS